MSKTNLIDDLRRYAEGSASTGASLMRDAADVLERYEALNELFLDMRDRVAGYMGAPPVGHTFSRGADAFEFAATNVRRAGEGKRFLNPPVPIRALGPEDPAVEGWGRHLLTCPDCGDRFWCASAKVRIEHNTHDEVGTIYHLGRVISTEGSGS